MKSLLFAVALAAALSPAFRQTRRYSQAPFPPPPPQSKPCDEATKSALHQRFLKNYDGDADRQKEASEAAKEYLCRCADYDAASEFIGDWLRKRERPAATDAQTSGAAADGAKPRCRCDEMREEMLRLTKEGMSGYDDGRGRNSYETATKFLRVCGDRREKFDRFVYDWVEKYEKVVREFEERQKAAEPPAKDPAKEQPE
jgi:hypothetical protein